MSAVTPVSEPLVGVLLLNWNGYTDTRACLHALADSTHRRWRAYVLDNGSRTDEAAALRDEFPAADIVRVPANLGYAGGHVALAPRALAEGCDYLLLLNNDTLVPPEMIAELVRTYRQLPDAGLLAARERLEGSDSAPDRLGATFRPLFCLVRWQFAPREAELPVALPWPVVSGCAVLVSQPVLERVGMLDESFFAYWEDVDWSLRMEAAGYRNYCAGHAFVRHHSGASTAAATGPNLTQLYLVCRGQALLTRKHARGLARLLAPLRALAGITATGLVSLVRPGRRPVARAKLRGFCDGWRRRAPDRHYVS